LSFDAFVKSVLGLWPLLVIGLAVVFTWLILLYHRTHRTRTAHSFRGNCRDCGYQPGTGTQVCPECGGSVLDTRLFRPLGSAPVVEQELLRPPVRSGEA
jgi:hypothetical protein